MFCAPGLVFGGTVGVRSRFPVFALSDSFSVVPSVRLVPFSCFAGLDSFSTVPRASGPVFMFCAPGLIVDGVEGVGSRFHFFAPGHIFGDADGVGSHFHVWRSCTRFRRYRERPILFLCFPLSDMFSVVLRASGPVFMFFAPGLVLGGTESVRSRFHFLRSRTHFRRYIGCHAPCLARPDSFLAVSRSSGPVLMFCAPGLVFGDIEGVGPYVLRARTQLWRYRGRRVPFSSFVHPKLISTLPSVSGSIFMFCALGLVFGGTEGVPSSFHVFRSRTSFQRY
jgi:hypothetical protein